MTNEKYELAKKIIKENDDIADFTDGCSDVAIKKAEHLLNLKFDGVYLDFLLTFGAGNFGSQEIYGIIHDDFEQSSVPDSIWFTLTERKEQNLPSHLLVIHDTTVGELYCLDFSNTNASNEPKVVSYILGVELNEQVYKLVADDFGEFLLNLVSQELE
ncbi:SMI1/KNR4 family protein [Alkalicoccobacillus porphyridii]|uniref:SMI1/KNR4 family protein n=1 Tax=Alkalicoccobacillus porphyridii TaxID=2597270 RepID=A0A554A4E7_9BACI|nr:SMI1/KNR4 family protein [Alkalicoccobacillus porphyridii]TSB48563.1 SMI1/KNR4 family protein [Alkalicoccobacillus porphyridii]